MRKHTARHWLHAALDLLPVLLIPVFMIYSHRHSLTERTQVDIQYKYQSNEVNTYDDLQLNNLYHLDDFSLYNNGTGESFTIHCVNFLVDSYNYTDSFIDENYLESLIRSDVKLNILFDYDVSYVVFDLGSSYVSLELSSFEIDFVSLDFFIDNASELSSFKLYCNDERIIPSSSDYNVIESVEVNDETSSVMNVFMDNFNGAIDKYFNMGNVFGMTNVYQWFNTNIFGGNAPTIIFSVWNIVLYEFVMDLIFLLYALFMWFIDVTKRLIEKPLDSIK